MTLVQEHDRQLTNRRRARRLAERSGAWMQLWVIVTITVLVIASLGRMPWSAAAFVAAGQSVLVLLAWSSNLMAYRFERRRAAIERRFQETEAQELT